MFFPKLLALQVEHLDLSTMSSLVNATLHTLNDSILPSVHWVLELLDDYKRGNTWNRCNSNRKNLSRPNNKVIYRTPKENISSRFLIK